MEPTKMKKETKPKSLYPLLRNKYVAHGTLITGITMRSNILLVGLACAFLYSILSSNNLIRPFYQAPTLDNTFMSSLQAVVNSRPDEIATLQQSKGIEIGLLSDRPTNFFRDLQREIDVADNKERCQRYGYSYNSTKPMKHRRIFYGALMASEPWELFDIVGAETYAIFSGVVMVEANRTQNFSVRNFTRLHHQKTFQGIFGVDNVQIRAFVNEDPKLIHMNREQMQRAEILKGWKDLGMQPEDIGLLSDADEIFTRDYLRAVQTCDGIAPLDYHKHRCQPSNGLRASTLVFETSPECVTDRRSWFLPNMFNGHCIEEIGNETIHPKATRGPNPFARTKGVKYNSYPLYNAAEFRSLGGITQTLQTRKYPTYSQYTAFHFHNFFTRSDAVRFKYRTYGKRSVDASRLV